MAGEPFEDRNPVPRILTGIGPTGLEDGIAKLRVIRVGDHMVVGDQQQAVGAFQDQCLAPRFELGRAGGSNPC